MRIKDELVHGGPGGTSEKAVIKDIEISDTLMTITRAQIKADLTADVTNTIPIPTWNQSTTGNAATATTATTATTAINGVHYLVSTIYDDWKANTVYAVDKIVRANGYIYKCKTAHTSASSFSSTNWTQLDTYYATSSTLDSITTGTTVAFIVPGYGMSTTYLSITLKDGSTVDKKIIKVNGGNLTTHFTKDTLLICTCDGTYWKCYMYDSNTLPSAYCTTGASALAKTASCNNYYITNNMKHYIHLIMLYTNSYTADTITLNINNLGAKPLYINGVKTPTTDYTLYAGSYIVYYDGTNYQLRTDGVLPGEAQSVAWSGVTGKPTYWANIQLNQTAAAYNKEPEFATMKLGNGTSATATSYCQQVYDSTNKCLKFVFV